MSQIDFHVIIRQQQEQLAAMQAQIQALLVGGAGGQVGREEGRGGGVEVIKIVDGRLYFIFLSHFILLYFTFSFLIFYF